MMEMVCFSLAHGLLFVLYAVFGMTLLPASLRRGGRRPYAFLVAPLLGAAVWVVLGTSWRFAGSPWNLPVRLLLAAVWCGVRRKTLFLPKEWTPYAVLAVGFVFSVGVSRLVYPFEIGGGLYFSFAVYDHVRCAIVNAIAQFGIPPVNPWLAENGRPVPLFYYFGWYAWAAQLPALAKTSALFAESCMTGFSALAAVSGLAGVAGLCGLGRRRLGMAAFLFSLLFMFASDRFVQRLLPERVFGALNSGAGFVGFWPHADNFVWSPHHMFSGAVVVLALFFWHRLLGAKAGGGKAGLAVLVGILAASAAFTSVYAGLFGFVYAAVAGAGLYAARGAFRRRVNRNLWPQLLAAGVFALLSVPYFRYLTAVRSETFPVAFGMMPAYGPGAGWARWLRYLAALYGFHMPMNLGLVFPLGMVACLAPRVLPRGGLASFARVFALVSLAGVTVVHSSFYSNDFGWRTFTAAAFLLSGFGAYLLVAFADWVRAGRTGRKAFGCALAGLLVVFECILCRDAAGHVGIRRTYPELRGQFARSVKGWDVVHRHTAKTDLVQCNPRSFRELGMLYEMEEYAANIFFSLYSERATAIGDLIFSKCYSEYYPQEKLQQRHDRVCRIFDGDPAEPDIAYLAGELKVKAVLVTPYDGLWQAPGAILDHYPRLIQTPDYRVYLPAGDTPEPAG